MKSQLNVPEFTLDIKDYGVIIPMRPLRGVELSMYRIEDKEWGHARQDLSILMSRFSFTKYFAEPKYFAELSEIVLALDWEEYFALTDLAGERFSTELPVGAHVVITKTELDTSYYCPLTLEPLNNLSDEKGNELWRRNPPKRVTCYTVSVYFEGQTW